MEPLMNYKCFHLFFWGGRVSIRVGRGLCSQEAAVDNQQFDPFFGDRAMRAEFIGNDI